MPVSPKFTILIAVSSIVMQSSYYNNDGWYAIAFCIIYGLFFVLPLLFALNLVKVVAEKKVWSDSELKKVEIAFVACVSCAGMLTFLFTWYYSLQNLGGSSHLVVRRINISSVV